MTRYTLLAALAFAVAGVILGGCRSTEVAAADAPAPAAAEVAAEEDREAERRRQARAEQLRAERRLLDQLQAMDEAGSPQAAELLDLLWEGAPHEARHDLRTAYEAKGVGYRLESSETPPAGDHGRLHLYHLSYTKDPRRRILPRTPPPPLRLFIVLDETAQRVAWTQIRLPAVEAVAVEASERQAVLVVTARYGDGPEPRLDDDPTPRPPLRDYRFAITDRGLDRIGAPPPERIVVSAVHGTPNVVRQADDEPWQRAVVGMELGLDAVIRVGLRSHVQITVNEQTVYLVDRLDAVALRDVLDDPIHGEDREAERRHQARAERRRAERRLLDRLEAMEQAGNERAAKLLELLWQDAPQEARRDLQWAFQTNMSGFRLSLTETFPAGEQGQLHVYHLGYGQFLAHGRGTHRLAPVRRLFIVIDAGAQRVLWTEVSLPPIESIAVERADGQAVLAVTARHGEVQRWPDDAPDRTWHTTYRFAITDDELERISPPPPEQIVVSAIRGTAQVLGGPEEAWKPVEEGMELPLDATLRIGPRSRIELTMNESFVYMVERLGSFTLLDILNNPRYGPRPIDEVSHEAEP